MSKPTKVPVGVGATAWGAAVVIREAHEAELASYGHQLGDDQSRTITVLARLVQKAIDEELAAKAAGPQLTQHNVH